MEMYQKENKEVIQKNKIKLVSSLGLIFFLQIHIWNIGEGVCTNYYVLILKT